MTASRFVALAAGCEPDRERPDDTCADRDDAPVASSQNDPAAGEAGGSRDRGGSGTSNAPPLA